MFRVQATFIANADQQKAKQTETIDGVNNLLNEGIEKLA